MKFLKICIFITYFIVNVSFAQNLQFSEDYFYDLRAYHLADFDFDNKAMNPDFFSYTLSYNHPENKPKKIAVEFEMRANLPAFGLQDTRLLYILTNPFPFLGEVNLTSRDLGQEFDQLQYTGGPNLGEPLAFNGIERRDHISKSKLNEIQNEIIAMGELPQGNYVFNLAIYDQNYNRLAGHQNIVSITSSEILDLIEPGGAESEDLKIFTTYPVFRWDMAALRWSRSYCQNCGIYIRVSEYLPDEHNSPEEALDSQSNLPFPDNGDFYKIEATKVPGTDETYRAPDYFSYPVGNAKPLESGHSYVWQIKKVFPTSSGSATIFSPIWIFKVIGSNQNAGNLSMNSNTNQINPDKVRKILEEILGFQELQNIYKSELQGYQMTGEIYLNNRIIGMEALKNISEKILSNEINIKSISVK
ncbi:MAG: hypothetical protein K9M80_08335 [Candidatus Marinimicrobia bacterium]|nr:hypothetical protein [Candidatus Neomarinimicrobiota bacterium]